ncbi:uncharacterized protein, partial [Mycetomoellerius zeteki]|uniref:uncharacterized protein n=1 Tax=Mycetomoellerius zeteki TaxID=64791 RepID=UPI00084E9084
MAKILGSLPSKYNALITAWDSVDPTRQSLDNLRFRLLKEESRLTTINETANALAAVKVSKPKQSVQREENKKRKSDHKSTTECYYCHKIGHSIKYCRKRLQKIKDNESESKDKKQNTSAFYVDSDFDNSDRKNLWFLDSGASCHMTFNKNWFHEFVETSNNFISLADQGLHEIKGKGTILIKRFVDGAWHDGRLENVLYVPTMKKNLFSVGACTRKNYTVVFTTDHVKISLNDDVRAVGMIQDNNLYRMLFK